MTEGLGELRSCSAMAGPIHGGSARADAVAVQNLMKLRRLMPCCSSSLPTVSSLFPWLIVLSLAWSRGQAQPLAQRLGRRCDFIGRAREYFRYSSHFQQLGNQFAVRITMLHPPDPGYAGFPKGRHSFGIDRRFNLAMTERPLKFGAVVRAQRQAAQVDCRRHLLCGKLIEQSHEFLQDGRDSGAR